MPIKKDYLYFYRGTESDYLQYVNNGDLSDKAVFFTVDTRTIYYDGAAYGINDSDPTSANRIKSVSVLDDGNLEVIYTEKRKKLSAILHRKFKVAQENQVESFTDEKIASTFDKNEDVTFTLEDFTDEDVSLKSVVLDDKNGYEIILGGLNSDSGIIEGTNLDFKLFSYFTLVIGDRVFQTVFRIAKNIEDNNYKLVIHKISNLGAGQDDELRTYVHSVVDASIMSIEDQMKWKDSY